MSSGASEGGDSTAKMPDENIVNSPVAEIKKQKQKRKKDPFHKRMHDILFDPNGGRKVSDELREIYFNLPLPDSMINPKNGLPVADYPRNKIRTTKYTPITFLPKNLLFQFTNIANSYFLFIIILGAFQIFGVSNPGLQAVPLIVIVCLTAIKDGFEDYSRGNSDFELNNSRVHILTGLHNPNVSIDHVSTWRKFKKACSRGTRSMLRGLGRLFRRNKTPTREVPEDDLENNGSILERVVSVPTTVHSYRSHRSHNTRSHFVPNTVVNPHVTSPEVSDLKFKNGYWKDISVGDIIRVRNDEEVPADCVILSSSDPEGNCYIETKNLDGETNLKLRSGLNCGVGLRHAVDFDRVQMVLETEAPNLDLYKFKGVVKYTSFESEHDQQGTATSEPVVIDNVLLRGCTLRNTKWALCVVISTGYETKIIMNSGETPTKKSKISKELNLSVIFNFCALFVMCFISGLVNGLFYDKDDTSRLFFEYKPYAPTPAANGTLAYFVALILYQTLVPISLYVSIEIIKTIQAYFIHSDLNMYYERLDFPCTPKSWNISDDLGQIEYIFSDKTGTLTQNVMEFKKCTIAGKSYGLAYTEAQQGMDKRAGVDIITEANKMKKMITKDKEVMIDQLKTLSDNEQFVPEDLTFVSSAYVEDVKSSGQQKQYNEEFMISLALCHTVITETNDDGLLVYKANSPDEAALVSVAKDVGIVFHEKTRKGQVVQIYDNDPIEFEILETIPFDSTRKRMTVILRVPEGHPTKKAGDILLISKGADNVIYERLAKDSDSNILSKTAIYLGEFAKEGLRTLCIAEKTISPKEFEEWHQRYKAASASIEDDRDERLGEIGDEIEQELTLLGGTAIEDRLQDGVPDSIALLAKAGIKLWVLTGDKVETAINIGFSCNLLGNDMELLVVQGKENDESSPEVKFAYIEGLITKYLTEKFGIEGTEADLEVAQKDHSPPDGDFALIIDGASLGMVFDNDELKLKFLLLCKNCRSVLCCRVSPAQKAHVVLMVKDSLRVMTLAIGDGANDVAMIQAANVGVGIAGEEGRQAVMSSDYAIGQFRFLVRLLLVHGRWSYKRLAEMIPCFFYKNITFVFCLFWWSIFSNFDGSYLFEYTYLMFFNLAFTSLPVIFLAVLDQDVNDVVSLLNPELYRTGILGLEWSQFKFLYYMLDGLYQSVISFFFPYLLHYSAKFANKSGLALDHRFWLGVYVAHIAVISCNIYILLQQKRWDYVSGIIYSLSILVIFFWTGVWSSSLYSSQQFYKVAAQCYGSVTFWACLFIGIVCCLLPRFTYDVFNRLYRPRDIDIIRERYQMGAYKDYPEGYDPTNLQDVEKHRIMVEQANSSEDEQEKAFDEDVEANDRVQELRPRSNTIKKVTNFLNPFHQSSNTDNSPQMSPLEVIRSNMLKNGEVSNRSSFQGMRTSQEIGISTAEGLMKVHTRASSTLR